MTYFNICMLIGIYRPILCKYFIFLTKVGAYDRKFNYTFYFYYIIYIHIYLSVIDPKRG